MKIQELIHDAIELLTQNEIEDSITKARLLLQYVLKQDKNDLIIHCNKEVTTREEIEYKKYLEEIIQGKPLQYITNSVEFMGLRFYVDENVLIPQPDTEVLVEETIKVIANKIETKQYSIIKILDLCTGSGAIAISIAKQLIEKSRMQANIKFEIYAIDISKKAIEIAEKNAKLNNTKIEFIRSDMFQEIEKLERTFDVIVSNPPYIETNTIRSLSKEVQSEPYIALDGGEDGLHFYRIIARESKKYLTRNGTILLEIGYNQKECVSKLFEARENVIACICDLAGNNRVIRIET